jgi:hypothetical protein
VYLQNPPGGDPIEPDKKLVGIHAYSQWEPGTSVQTTPTTPPASMPGGTPPVAGQGGFLPGDGALIDPRFADAKVGDGSLSQEAGAQAYERFNREYPPAGPGSMLSFQKWTAPIGADNKSHLSFSIRKHISADNAQAYFVFATAGKFEEQDDEHSLSREISRTLIRNDYFINRFFLIRGYDSPPIRHEYCTRLVVYREVFLIHFGEVYQSNPAVTHAMGQGVEQVILNAKKLIDLRFPEK